MQIHAVSPAIACESGGFRCVFVHGALAALEAAGLRASAYASASASVLPAAFAAIARAGSPGIEYWHEAREVRMREGNGMSEMVLAGLEKYGATIEAELFAPGRPPFIVTASEVVDADAAIATQGPHASRLGREQLLAMARGDSSWAERSLRCVSFDSAARGAHDRLDAVRFRDVAYASSRMLHAWRVPATIDGRPFIDASYTDGFPVSALAERGARRILAIATGPGESWTNLYHRRSIADAARVGTAFAELEQIAPRADLKELGVDFTTATNEGLERAFEEGRRAATEWLRRTTW